MTDDFSTRGTKILLEYNTKTDSLVSNRLGSLALGGGGYSTGLAGSWLENTLDKGNARGLFREERRIEMFVIY